MKDGIGCWKLERAPRSLPRVTSYVVSRHLLAMIIFLLSIPLTTILQPKAGKRREDKKIEQFRVQDASHCCEIKVQCLGSVESLSEKVIFPTQSSTWDRSFDLPAAAL